MKNQLEFCRAKVEQRVVDERNKRWRLLVSIRRGFWEAAPLHQICPKDALKAVSQLYGSVSQAWQELGNSIGPEGQLINPNPFIEACDREYRKLFRDRIHVRPIHDNMVNRNKAIANHVLAEWDHLLFHPQQDSAHRMLRGIISAGSQDQDTRTRTGELLSDLSRSELKRDDSTLEDLLDKVYAFLTMPSGKTRPYSWNSNIRTQSTPGETRGDQNTSVNRPEITPSARGKSSQDHECPLCQLERLNKEIPQLDASGDDWIVGAALARKLGIEPTTLANRRSAGDKGQQADERYGGHDEYLFWRQRENKHPRYFLPRAMDNTKTKDRKDTATNAIQQIEVIDDSSVADKRALFLEDDFGAVLTVAERQGNILKALIRRAWDDRDLQTVTKTCPLKATKPHVSIIGHITQDDLSNRLRRVDITNGFAIRFLWICVKRSKYLPR